jgi:enterochelin esterase-like enzyme
MYRGSGERSLAIHLELMKRSALLLLVGGLLAVAAASASPAARDLDVSFTSKALRATLHYEIVLPPDYDTSGQRYPVIYFLHGLPSGASAYKDVGFLERALDGSARKAILIAPQGARAGEPDPEYLDRGAGKQWETAIAQELVRVVDARYRTIPSRSGRALIGLSAGGYGAMHLGLEHLRDFSVVESWSGYFHPTDPTGARLLDLGSDDENTRANVHAQARKNRTLLRALPTLVAFYVGRDDTRFVAENRQLDEELTRGGVPHVFRIYSGGHEHSLWQRYAPSWLQLALAHLATARS